MKKVGVSEFKAKCIALLRAAQQTGESILDYGGVRTVDARI